MTPSLCKRVRQLQKARIEFIPNPAFEEPGMEERTSLGEAEYAAPWNTKPPAKLPGHLARLCEARLLTAEEEASLFRRMNFLKFQAVAIRGGLDARRPERHAVELAEKCLTEAEAIRDRIVQANMRLVMSVVKQFVSPQHSYDEMLSDGIYSLIKAVEKFDYDRGFRFSTYAYRAITRNAHRRINTQRQEAARFASNPQEPGVEAVDDRATSPAYVEAWMRRRGLLATLMNRLDRRERFVIRSRYALGAHRKVRTFQCLADKLGVSKERVRQLERRAVTKLKTFAAEFPLDDGYSGVLAHAFVREG